jgi:hypothetical protein
VIDDATLGTTTGRISANQTDDLQKDTIYPTAIGNYWPKEEALNGTYKSPPVKRVE